jgi:hypothetical protein
LFGCLANSRSECVKESFTATQYVGPKSS